MRKKGSLYEGGGCWLLCYKDGKCLFCVSKGFFFCFDLGEATLPRVDFGVGVELGLCDLTLVLGYF